MECTAWSLQCVVCSVHCAKFSVQCAVWTVQCPVSSVQIVVCSLHCADCSVRVQSALYLILLKQFSLFSCQKQWEVHCTVLFCIMVQFTALWCTAFFCNPLHYTKLYCTPLHGNTLQSELSFTKGKELNLVFQERSKSVQTITNLESNLLNIHVVLVYL